MATTRTTVPDQRLGGQALDTTNSEWSAVSLRPVAHWVLMPTPGGASRLSMVWEIPDPIPPGLGV
jgi:hypothetical protein